MYLSLSEYFQLKNNTQNVIEASVVVSDNSEEKVLVELLEDNGINALDVLLDEEFRIGVRNVIDLLEERQRQCILLYYGRNLNLSEVAKVFEITPSRVSQILSKARAILVTSLREIAQEAGYDVGE